MKQASFYNDDGEIVGTIFATDEEIRMNTPSGCSVVEGLWSDELYWVKDGEPTAYTPEQLESIAGRPGMLYTWSNKLMAWVGSLTPAERYQEAINAPVVFKGATIQADPKSLAALKNALMTSSLIDGYTIEWRTQSNDWITLNGSDLAEIVKMISTRNNEAFKNKYR